MSLFKNKYRIESTRLPGWDYSRDGAYFVTICAKDKECLFGDIVDGEMNLNEMGQIVENEFLKSFEIRNELFCDFYIIMPDHLHAIVIIDNDDRVETHGRASLHGDNNCMPKRQPKSISSFVAGFKSSVTKKINQLRQTPGVPVWQPRYHDHIIRDTDELNRIRKYIQNNPAKWKCNKDAG